MKKCLVLLIFCLIVVSCGKKEVKKDVPIEEIPVKVDTVKEKTVNEALEYPKIVFTVQIAALKNENFTFRNIESIQVFEEDYLTKYRLGQFKTYQEARKYRASIIKKYPDAFIQALKNNNPISIREAIK